MSENNDQKTTDDGNQSDHKRRIGSNSFASLTKEDQHNINSPLKTRVDEEFRDLSGIENKASKTDAAADQDASGL